MYHHFMSVFLLYGVAVGTEVQLVCDTILVSISGRDIR